MMRQPEKSLTQLSVLARQDYNEYATQLQRLEELQKARLHRRRYLQGQVQRHLLVENDLIHLAHARRDSEDPRTSFTPAEQLQSLRETNKALRLKIREKEKLIQTLLKTQERPGEKSQLQAMIIRNKQYLDEIKLRNMEFKKELENMYYSDPKRETYKVAQLKQRLGECEQRIEQYQQEQLKLRHKLDEQRQSNSSLSQQNHKFQSVLNEYQRELDRYRDEFSQNLQERLTFLLTENTQSAVTIDNLQSENIKLKEEIERFARGMQVSNAQYEAKEKEMEQMRLAFREMKERYAGIVEERSRLLEELQKEREEVSNLAIQVGNLENLRQLEREEMQDKENETKSMEQQRNGDELRVLKEEYDMTIKQLTEQNEQLVKQLENIFEMKSRNEQEHLKTLKIQEEMQTNLATLENKLVDTQQGELKTLVSRLQLENVRLTGEKEQLLRQVREKKESAVIVTQNSSQHRISMIQHNNDQDTNTNQLQFLKDQLQSGHKNLNLLKQQLQMVQHQDRIKGGQIRKLVSRINELQSELEQHKEFRQSLDERIVEMNERLRSKSDEVEELLDKNARLSQKVFEQTQKFGEGKAKLEEEVRFKALKIQELEGQLAEKPKVELKDNQLDVAKEEIRRLNQQISMLREESIKSSAERQALNQEVVHLKEAQVRLSDQITQLLTRKNMLEQQYHKHRQITDNFSTERESLKSRISSLSDDGIKNVKQIQRLAQLAEELVEEISIKQKQIKFLIEQNTKIKVQTKKILEEIKHKQEAADKMQEETVSGLLARIQKSKSQVQGLKRKLQERQKQNPNKSKQTKQPEPQTKQYSRKVKNDSCQKQKSQKKQQKGSKAEQKLPHDYVILLKDLQQSIKATSLISDELQIFEGDEQNLNTLRQARMLIVQMNKELHCPKKQQEELLLSQPTLQKSQLEKEILHLQEELQTKKNEYSNGMKELEDFIVTRQKEFSQKISSLQGQLNQLKSAAALQQRQSINWSDLRDVNPDLEYSDSTLKRQSVRSERDKSQPVDSIQNLDEKNEARKMFQQELLELINKHLSLSTNKLAQLTFEFSSNLFLYPNHTHFVDFLERFLEGLKFYEEFELKKTSQLKSKFLEYFGQAQELIEQHPSPSQSNLLSDTLDLFPIRAGDNQLYSSEVRQKHHQASSLRKSSKSALQK